MEGKRYVKEKTTEELSVEIDDLSLSLVGWQVEDIRARLVTGPHWDSGYKHEVVVSGTLRFLPEDWTDRFAYEGYVSLPLITLSRKDPSGPTSFITIDEVDLKTASRRSVRLSMKSDEWRDASRCTASDVKVGITAYDLEEVYLEYANSRLDMCPRDVTELPVDIVDETTYGSIRPKSTIATARLRRGMERYDDDSGDVRVHLEGLFEFGSADELLTDFVSSDPSNEHRVKDKDKYPIEVSLPNVEVEVLDGTGFLLGKKKISFLGRVRVAESGGLPGRHPRWLAYVGELLEDYAGEPARVLARFVDGDES
jgi:hypothetical protein